jgi:hypothetical protein
MANRTVTIIDDQNGNKFTLELSDSTTLSASGKNVTLLNQGIPLDGGLWFKALVTRKPRSGDTARD